MNAPRYHRSTREAFPAERFAAMFGPYRAPGRWLLPLGWACLCALAAVGGLLAWGG